MIRYVIALMLLVLTQAAAIAQSASDTAFVLAARKNAIDAYQKITHWQSTLYNGVLYAESPSTDNTHAFFLSSDWLEGSVVYQGHRFDSIPLQYDLVYDLVITELPNATPIGLLNERLTSFDIGERHFVKLQAADGIRDLPREGFYELLYNGPTRVLAHHEKTRNKAIESSSVITLSFEQKSRYYFIKDNVCIPVKNIGTGFQTLSDKKSELKKFVSQHKLRQTQALPDALVKMAAYYDHLKQTRP